MKEQKSDLWLNIYVFLLLPFCIIINVLNLYKYIKGFNSYNNLFISISLIVLSIIAILLYAYTFYYAKDRVKKSYNFLLITVVLSTVSASYNQAIETYLGQGFKFYLMIFVYIILYTCLWALPNYVYLKRRKDMFVLNRILSKEELKEKIENHIKSQEKKKEVTTKTTKITKTKNNTKKQNKKRK